MGYRKQWRTLAVVLCIVLLAFGGLSACGKNSKDTDDKEKARYKFTVVLSSSAGDFTKAFEEGATAAGERIGCDITVIGPDKQIVEDEVAMAEKALESGIDGLAVVAGDTTAFRKVRDLADQKKIPMVTFNMDDGGDPPGAHPGYGIGYSGANEYIFAQIFAEKFFGEIAKDAKTYIIATADAGLPVCATRAQAIKDVAEKAGKKLLATVNIGYEFERGYSIIDSALATHPDVNAILGTDQFSLSIANVVGDRKLGDTIQVGCFDPLPGTIQRLKTGDCDLIADQNPYLQAYYAVFNLLTLKEDGVCAWDVNTGALTWTREQAEELEKKYSQ
jgi:ABC-type sugar transport system substrate-binding protein